MGGINRFSGRSGNRQGGGVSARRTKATANANSAPSEAAATPPSSARAAKRWAFTLAVSSLIMIAATDGFNVYGVAKQIALVQSASLIFYENPKRLLEEKNEEEGAAVASSASSMGNDRGNAIINSSRNLRAVDREQTIKGKQSAEAVSCQGKEPLLDILRKAGLLRGDEDDGEAERRYCQQLPTWKEVSDLYGSKPVVHGLKTCERYRSLLSPDANNGTAVEPIIRVAGLLNTGTHTFAQSLAVNVKPWDGVPTETPYQVPWGKHVPPRYRWNSTIPWYNSESKAHVLPIVIVKDPFRWMASMCKSSYFVRWEHVLGHCPNLVRPNVDRGGREDGEGSWRRTYNVTVPYWRTAYTDEYDSLADLWTEWNREYLEADFPRLMIRYEDMLFHAEEIVQTIKDCAGIPSQQGGEPFQYITEQSKNCGQSSDFVQSLVKYGTVRGRYACLSEEDAYYAQRVLDPELMRIFHYPQIPSSYTNSSSSSTMIRCPGHDPDSKWRTGWVDRRATYTESDYAREMAHRPWRRPGPEYNNTLRETERRHILRYIALQDGRRERQKTLAANGIGNCLTKIGKDKILKATAGDRYESLRQSRPRKQYRFIREQVAKTKNTTTTTTEGVTARISTWWGWWTREVGGLTDPTAAAAAVLNNPPPYIL